MSQDWLKASLLPKRCAEIFLAESVRDTWLFGGMFVYAREAEDFFFLINWKRAGDLMTIHTSPSLRAKSILTHQLPPPPPPPPPPPLPSPLPPVLDVLLSRGSFTSLSQQPGLVVHQENAAENRKGIFSIEKPRVQNEEHTIRSFIQL